MSFLGNLLWLVCGGLLSGLGWLCAGLFWCITIVGIPIGIQCIKLSGMSFAPFGKEVRYEGGAGSFLVNILWFFFSGLELALGNFFLGCLLCITVVGIPFGMQFFKLAVVRQIIIGSKIFLF